VKVVVDTNVLAYFLLGTEPYRGECAAFWRVIRQPLAPASFEAEIANVLWMAVRSRVVDVDGALDRLVLAASLRIRSFAVAGLWEAALVRACKSGVAVYDTLFVELAAREKVPLATYDGALQKKFPRIAQSPRRLIQE